MIIAAVAALAGCGSSPNSNDLAVTDLQQLDTVAEIAADTVADVAVDSGTDLAVDVPITTDDGTADLVATDDGANDEGTLAPVCEIACNGDEDCGYPGYFCASHKCTLRHVFCYDERWSMNDRGETDDCMEYRCDPIMGTCPRTADSTANCNTPWAWWDVDYSCVPTVQGCDTATPECQAALLEWSNGRDAWVDTHPAGSLPPVTAGCEKPCTTDSDCNDEMCYYGTCRPIDLYCAMGEFGWESIWPHRGEFDVSGNLVRESSPCMAGYGCDMVMGACRTDCLRTGDCQGLNCYLPDHTCI
jgi:hypothetical protein